MSSLPLCHEVAFDDTTHKSQVVDLFFIYNGYVHWYYARCWDLSFAIPWNNKVRRVGRFLYGRASVLTACIKDKVHGVDHYPLCHHFGSFDKVNYMLDWFLSVIKSWFSACAQLLAWLQRVSVNLNVLFWTHSGIGLYHAIQFCFRWNLIRVDQAWGISLHE